MDGRSILPLVTAPASSNSVDDSNGDTASTVELHNGDPPKACSPGALRQDVVSNLQAHNYMRARCCAADPCNGHGVCLEPLSPQCFCNQQYTGLRCERCSAGHENYPACTEVPWREKFLFEYVSPHRSVAQFDSWFANVMPVAGQLCFQAF